MSDSALHCKLSWEVSTVNDVQLLARYPAAVTRASNVAAELPCDLDVKTIMIRSKYILFYLTSDSAPFRVHADSTLSGEKPLRKTPRRSTRDTCTIRTCGLYSPFLPAFQP